MVLATTLGGPLPGETIPASADALLDYLASRAFDAPDAPQRLLLRAEVVLVATVSELRSEDLGGDRILQTAVLDAVTAVSGNVGARPTLAWIDEGSSLTGAHASLAKGRRGVVFARALTKDDDQALLTRAPGALTPAVEPALVTDDSGDLAAALTRWAAPDKEARVRDDANREALLNGHGVAFQIALADAARTHASAVLNDVLPRASGVRALLVRAALYRSREKPAATSGLDVSTLPADVLATLALGPIVVGGTFSGWVGPAASAPLAAHVPEAP